MDAYEATKVVFQRIQCLDPENASKIMGLLLIQDHGEKEMIRLALGPEALVHSVVVKARKELSLSSNTPSTPSTPSSPSPFSNSLPFSRQSSSGRVALPSPLSIPSHSSSNPASPWANASGFSDFQTTEDLVSPAGSAALCANGFVNGLKSASMNSSAAPFYGGGEVDLMDELQLQEQLSFLNDGSPTLGPKNPEDYPMSAGGSREVLFPSYGGGGANWGGGPHRRSFSVSDISLGSDDLSGGFGWRPCLYFAKGFCKNGTTCRFSHGESGLGSDGAAMVASPNKFDMMENCQDLLRSQSAQQQRLAAASQLLAANGLTYSPRAGNKSMNFLLQQQQLHVESPRAVAALMMGDDLHKFSRSRLDRGDFGMNGVLGMANPGSRQIYLTFPADSTFREEDVSNYFSIYGPVQDVRIPYQQKRMFGFVTFVYPETVKIILAKGNPHFVCEARVLVKPYKEKGKVPEKYRKQQMERSDFNGCGSPTGLDSKDQFDLQLGARMLLNTQDMLWRRNLEEQADLQQAIELESRRLMGLQLLDVKRNSHHRALSMGAIVPSPTHTPSFVNQEFSLAVDRSSREVVQGNDSILKLENPSAVAGQEVHGTSNLIETSKESFKVKLENGNGNKSDFQESLEHNLPDSPFASPKAGIEGVTTFLDDAGEAGKAVTSSTSSSNNYSIGSPLFPAPSSIESAPFKSCYFHVPRLGSGHGTIGI